MTWRLVCKACASGESIRCIGVIQTPPAGCACCGAELPVGSNGLVDGRPVDDAQLARIVARVRPGAKRGSVLEESWHADSGEILLLSHDRADARSDTEAAEGVVVSTLGRFYDRDTGPVTEARRTGESLDRGDARARLAALAPEMARLLLDIERCGNVDFRGPASGVGCPGCLADTERGEAHDAACKLGAVCGKLRALAAGGR
jgi:hypothetical protein